MEENSLSSKQNKFHALALLEVGLLEVGFVSIVLLLFFGTLNYFNILSVSETFPSQFGWLPRRDVPPGTSQSNSLQGEALRNQEDTSSAPTSFQYDTEKAKSLLTNYIKETIKLEFLPSAIEIKQGLSSEGKMENIKYEFGWYFTDEKGIIFSANLHYVKDTSIVNDQEIFIQLPDSLVPNKSVDVDLANTIISKYLSQPAIKPILPSDCSNTASRSYCQVFNIGSAGKRGYGILIFVQPNYQIKTLFSCFTSKESPRYNETESCIVQG